MSSAMAEVDVQSKSVRYPKGGWFPDGTRRPRRQRAGCNQESECRGRDRSRGCRVRRRRCSSCRAAVVAPSTGSESHQSREVLGIRNVAVTAAKSLTGEAPRVAVHGPRLWLAPGALDGPKFVVGIGSRSRPRPRRWRDTVRASSSSETGIRCLEVMHGIAGTTAPTPKGERRVLRTEAASLPQPASSPSPLPSASASSPG